MQFLFCFVVQQQQQQQASICLIDGFPLLSSLVFLLDSERKVSSWLLDELEKFISVHVLYYLFRVIVQICQSLSIEVSSEMFLRHDGSSNYCSWMWVWNPVIKVALSHSKGQCPRL